MVCRVFTPESKLARDPRWIRDGCEGPGDASGVGRKSLSLLLTGVGDGIEASLGEGMAAEDASEREPGAPEDSEAVQRDVGVFRAGGQVDALRGANGVQQRREERFVGAPSYEDSL